MANTYLTRNQTGQSTTRTWTFSAWVKRGAISGDQRIYSCDDDASGNHDDWFRFKSDDKIQIGGYSNAYYIQLITTRLFRDTSAWYHLVVTVDTTQGTASNRVKLYVNGIQETSFSTATYPSQNSNTFVNGWSSNLYPLEIGRRGNGNSQFFNGSMSHIHFVDGTAYPASTFGSTDATTGEWKINTSPSITMGTNGFTILKDGNTITDQSSNSNDFTLGAGTLTNTEDCPSDVFATLNPLALTTRQTLSNGNLTGTSSSWTSAISTIGVTTGKWYAEMKCVSGSGDGMIAGVTDEKDMSSLTGSTAGLGFTTNSIGYYNTGIKYIADSSSSYGASFTDNDIIGIALDMTSSTKTVTFYKNGASQGAINLSTTGAGTVFVGSATSNGTTSMNFGNGYFGTTAISSEGSNASGIGKFEYDVPTGFTALSTKGLNT